MTPFDPLWTAGDSKPITMPWLPGYSRHRTRRWDAGPAPAVVEEKKPEPAGWTAEQDDFLISRYFAGAQVAEIANDVGLSYDVTRCRLAVLREERGIASRRPVYRRNLPAEKPARALIRIPMPPRDPVPVTGHDVIDVSTGARATDWPPPRVTLAAIKSAVCEVTGVSLADLESDRRSRHLVDARTLYYWVARRLTPKPLAEIGRRCGWRDHSTIVHGLSKTEAMERDRPKAFAAFKVLANRVAARLGERDL